MIQELEHRIRQRAHGIWESEGRPSDRAEIHWSMARAEIAAELPTEIPAETPKQAAAKSPAKPRTRKAAAPKKAAPKSA
jgi:hypothetical protein